MDNFRPPSFLVGLISKLSKYVRVIRNKLLPFFNKIKKFTLSYAKAIHKKLDNSIHWLKNLYKTRWFKPLVLLVLFSAFFNFFLYETRPAALNQQMQLQKQTISQQLNIVQSLRTPAEWEFGQRDTAASTQLQDLILVTDEYSTISNNSLTSWQSTVHFGDVAYGYDISGDYKMAKQEVQNLFTLGDDLITDHLSVLIGAQDFIEFNCEAYLIYQNSSSQELNKLINQTEEALRTIKDSDYKQAVDSFSIELNAFRDLLQPPTVTNPEAQNKACNQAQSTLRSEITKALNTKQEAFTNNAQDLSFTLSRIQTKLTR